MMEKYLENYKHYIYPISLFLILRKLRDDEISEKISNEMETFLDMETLTDYIDIVMYELEEKP